jgi:hypothetical protein
MSENVGKYPLGQLGDVGRVDAMAALRRACAAMSVWTASLLAVAALAQDGGSPPVQRNPEVGTAHNDSSPPLREIPPAKRKKGKRVHPVKPIPRPKPSPEKKQE